MSESIEYRTIENFSLYRIGSDGSVWSKIRKGPTIGIREDWKRLSPGNAKEGYQTVILRRDDGKRCSLRVGRDGTTARGEALSVVTEAVVLEVRDMILRKVPLRTIAKTLNLANGTVADISAGRNWRWLTGLGKERKYKRRCKGARDRALVMVGADKGGIGT